MCKLSLHYNYLYKPECFTILNSLKTYLEGFGVKATLAEGRHYGTCWKFDCDANVELSVAEQIYNYCDNHSIAADFSYRPGGNFSLVSSSLD